ncbi:MAG: aldo/keto reductase [Minisyncoccia bacterium]
MKYRNLGLTGIKVSEIGFGAWGIGGLSKGATSYGPTNDKESEKALLRAFELGVNFFDTANIYGEGHSEELLGKVFKKNRHRIVIATKAGYFAHNSPSDYSPANLRGSLKQSLRRLKTDYVDLYQLHDASIDIFKNGDETISTLKKLKKEGKIRAYGISVNSPNDGIAAIDKFGFPVVQVNFNMIDQRVLDCGLMDLVSKKNVGLIARTPFCFGFLTGKFSSGMFGKRDHRSTWPEKQRQVWSHAPLLFSDIAKREKSTPAQLALRYCLSFKPISSVIPGMLTEKEVNENLQAGILGPLRWNILKKIRIIYNSEPFFVAGPKID